MNKTIHVCNGCCCGHEEKGNPKVKNELFDKLLKNTNIKIERPYCLGPCSYANVIKVEIEDNRLFFKKINTKEDVKEIVEYAKSGDMSDVLKAKLLPF